jgi:hypothetical protein
VDPSLSCCYVLYHLPSICRNILTTFLYREQFDVKAYSIQAIFATDSVRQNDPDILACSQPIGLTIEMMPKFPIEVASFQNLITTHKSSKFYAFVFNHKLWNDLDLQAILEATENRAPYLNTQSGRVYSSCRTLQGS